MPGPDTHSQTDRPGAHAPRRTRFVESASAIVAVAVAFGSIAAAFSLIDAPASRARLDAFVNGVGPSVTLADRAGDAAMALARVTAERDDLRQRLASLEANPTEATGALGGSTRPVVDPLPAIAPAPAGSVAMRTTFGADLGTGSSLGDLRLLWQKAAVSLVNEPRSLQPLVALRERPVGYELHLLVGPTDNAADAARLCASLAAVAPTCAPVPFDGQRLPTL